jgi:hypothetical protein
VTVSGTWKGLSGEFSTISSEVEGGYTLSIFSPEGDLVVSHGAHTAIPLAEVLGSNSLVSSILRRDYGL